MIKGIDIQNNITSGLTITGARMRHRWWDKPTFVSAVISELNDIRHSKGVHYHDLCKIYIFCCALYPLIKFYLSLKYKNNEKDKVLIC